MCDVKLEFFLQNFYLMYVAINNADGIGNGSKRIPGIQYYNTDHFRRSLGFYPPCHKFLMRYALSLFILQMLSSSVPLAFYCVFKSVMRSIINKGSSQGK